MKQTSLKIDYFLYFLFVYFLFQIFIRVFISPSLELDESEQMLLSQQFAWGYNAQPPLYTWIQILFFELFGKNVFAISLLKNILLFSSYFFVYQSTKLITNNSISSSIAAASMILLPQISWESQRDLTHSVMLTSIASITFYLIMRIKYLPSQIHIGHYIFLGILIAAGMLAKYNFSIFIFALALVSFFDKDLRHYILSKRIFITFLIAFLLLILHMNWFVDHMDLAIGSTLNKLDIQKGILTPFIGIGTLFTVILAFLMPYLLFVLLIFRKAIEFKQDHFLFYFFIVIVLELTLFIFVTGTTNIKDRWMQPYFFLMVVYIASLIDMKKIQFSKISLYFNIVYFFMFIILLLSIVRVYFPDTIQKYYRSIYPFQTIAHQIKAKGFDEGVVIAENKLIGGNFKLNFPNSHVIVEKFNTQYPKGKKKTLIVWKKNFPSIAKKYKHLINETKVYSAKYFYSEKKDYSLNTAIIEF